MKFPSILLTVLLSVACSYAVATYTAHPESAPAQPVAKETTYERVMRTGTLRCGYFSWPPYMEKNPKTQTFDGFFYDYVETLARHMGIKVDWTAEVLYGSVYEEIKDGRIDAFCSGIWPTSGLAKLLDFTTPISFNGVFAVVRGDDSRFDGDLSRLNDPSVKIASMEGAIGSVIAATRFPKAALDETPALSGASAPFVELMSHKADVTFVDLLILKEFLKNNSGAIKLIEKVPAVNVWGNALAFGKNQDPLVNAVNTVTQEMLYSGEIAEILKKYGSAADGLYPVAPPYQGAENP